MAVFICRRAYSLTQPSAPHVPSCCSSLTLRMQHVKCPKALPQHRWVCAYCCSNFAFQGVFCPLTVCPLFVCAVVAGTYVYTEEDTIWSHFAISGACFHPSVLVLQLLSSRIPITQSASWLGAADDDDLSSCRLHRSRGLPPSWHRPKPQFPPNLTESGRLSTSPHQRGRQILAPMLPLDMPGQL